MEENKPAPTHILVCVSDTVRNETELASFVADCVISSGAKADLPDLKILSRQAPFATEFPFIPDGDAPQKMALKLRNFKGDWAVLPNIKRRKSLMLCDMDSTIIAQECLDELAQFAGIRDKVAAITEKAMAGEMNFEEALKARVAMLKGLPLFAIEQCYRNRIKLNPGAETLVRTMRKHGAMCMLVSGGFADFAKPVGEAAGFNMSAANVLLNDGTVLTGEVREPILGPKAKLDALNSLVKSRNLDLSETLCMGDGANDVDMVSAAGLGIAIGTKSVIVRKADAAIRYTDLTAALFFQGYRRSEFWAPGDA